MSIVDDRHDPGQTRRGETGGSELPPGGRNGVRPGAGHDGGLWHGGPPAVYPMQGHPSLMKRKGRRPADTPVLEAVPSGDDMWRTRLELVVSAGISQDTARREGAEAVRRDSGASFEAFRAQCAGELRPVLESSAQMLAQWGLSARVTENLRDHPTRLPRSFDLSLWIDRFDERGPGRLTITATEACDFVRVKLKVGPTWTGDIDEHVGTTVARDLSDALVGGLVATLVERIFSS